MTFLAISTIDILAQVISGGAGYNDVNPIGIYRSGPKIEQFLRSCNVDFSLNGQSRVPALTNTLIELNKQDNAQQILTEIIERAVDPRDFWALPGRHDAVLECMNTVLAYDNLKIINHSGIFRLAEMAQSVPISNALNQKVQIINFDTVQRDLERALNNVEKDPESAVTSACSFLESVFRSILIELGKPLPAKKDISGLYSAIRDPLGLGPDRTDLTPEIAADVREIMSGLITSVRGVGALRTHAGDAHGREKGFTRIDARIARLAIHSASTLGLFIIETWERKFPNTQLKHHDDEEFK